MRPLLLVLFLGACAPSTRPQQLLYVWTGAADSTAADFLAVFDVTERPDRSSGPQHSPVP